MPPTSDHNPSGDDELAPLLALGDAMDMATFGQILEMDDPGEHDFSASIVFDFFEQAEDTYEEMDMALEKSELEKLSSLGHFLKGSSATLGMVKVRDGCEKIQQYGKGEDEDGKRVDQHVCLQRIKEIVRGVRRDYAEVKQAFRAYYAQFE